MHTRCDFRLGSRLVLRLLVGLGPGTRYSRSPPVAYQVILEPGIGQFREFESPGVHTRIYSWRLFLAHKFTCGKGESVSKQHSMRNSTSSGIADEPYAR